MKRLGLVMLLVGAPFAPSSDAASVPSFLARAFAQEDDPSTKEAFYAAKELGTVEAWNAFLARYPKGFYPDLARAYLKRLAEGGAPAAPTASAPAVAPPPVQAESPPPSAPPAQAEAAPPAPPAVPPPARAETAPPPAPPAAPPPAARADAAPGLAPTDPTKPAVARGAAFMGFPEKFNRYYTDPAWKPATTLYVSPTGSGDGSSREKPMAPRAAVAAAKPGTRIVFTRGAYQGCFEFTKENSGTYDAPIVLYGERNEDKTLGVKLTCCTSGRQTCFNLEQADHIAIDGFEMVGGRYGVRAVGAGYKASEHSVGIAVIDCNGHDQNNDPFFSGQADWAVWERNVGSGAKAGDGHGIYISNGSDWNIVRFNETFGNYSSDFQINADPTSTCKEEGIAFNDPRCDAYAGEGEGGQGASDYFLVDGNFFHHGGASGANFTSVRRSVVRNNIFGIYPRHGVSFWQETDNPKLGSSDNKVLHNLFITTGRQGIQFINGSTRNEFANNILLGIRVVGGVVSANPAATLMEVDKSVGANVYRGNLYVSGKLEGRSPSEQEVARPDFSPAWFAKFPAALNRDPADFKPNAGAPFLGMGTLVPDASADRAGAARPAHPDPGPIEVP